MWDFWNVGHIFRHQVVSEEVEEVCHNRPVIWETYGGRLLVVGPTNSLRMLTAILAPIDDGVYYPVTARSASRQERRRYKAELMEDADDKRKRD